MKFIHESVANVLMQSGVKAPATKGMNPGNNRSFLREHKETLEADTDGVSVTMKGHPKLSASSFIKEDVKSAVNLAQKLCEKAGGFAIIEGDQANLTVTFTKDKAKAKVDIKEAKTETEDDETDGTGEASGDTKTNTKAKNDKGVGTKKGTKADNKGDENSEEVNEAEKKDAKVGDEDEGKCDYKDMVKRKKCLAAKKDKTEKEKTEEAELDAKLDQIAETFYESLNHPVTFVLYPNGEAEVHGLNEEEIAPFGGSAPAVPQKYSKQAKQAGPNSKVDMGVLSIYKTEGMSAESAKILTGKDFKACGWGTPGKGYGKQSRWCDTGKMPMDSQKKLKAGTEA